MRSFASESGAGPDRRRRATTVKGNCWLLIAGSFASFALTAQGVTRYVSLNSPGPAAPYTSWVSAATSIQAAVDVASVGDDILVAPGVYQTGAQSVYGMS